MIVTHLSKTPCANAIWSLASACSETGAAPSRWIGNGGEAVGVRFPIDTTWRRSDALSILAVSETLILHNYLDLNDQPIVDFLMSHPDMRVGVFYHSHPDYVNLEPLRNGVPAFVVNQFQADCFQARGLPFTPVRNVIRFDRPDFPERKSGRQRDVRVGWSPTTRKAQEGRPYDLGWYTTKGWNRTMPVLEAWANRRKYREMLLIERVPHAQALQWKAECDILVDEVVTGSFHRSTLEGLALGIPTVVRLAPELDQRITELAGGSEMPVVRCNGPEELDDVLERLSAMKKSERRDLGARGRAWMERHWHPRDIAHEFSEHCDSLPRFADLETR